MESSGNTPPTPPYSVPPPAGAGAAAIPTPNPSGGAAASAATRTAKALFVPPRANPGASLPPTAPKIKKTTSRRPAEAPAGAPNAKAPRVAGRGRPASSYAPAPTAAGAKGRGRPASSYAPAPTAAAAARPAPPRPRGPTAAAAAVRNVLDEMASSVDVDDDDDGTSSFVEPMDYGASSFVEEEEEEYEEYEEMDEEGEGMVEAPGGRKQNYNVDEDVWLCKAWLKIGMDPSIGTDQSRDTYWLRMKDFFDANNTSGILRTARSLRSRWSVINTDCSKWASANNTVDIINPSGTNEIDRNTMCQGMFRDEGKKNKKGKKLLSKAFTMHHCYDVLANEEKWKTQGRQDVPTFLAQQATGEAQQQTIVDDDDSSGDDDRKKRSSTPHSVSGRPPLGRKSAKTLKGRKAGEDDMAKAMDNMVKARESYNEDKKAAEARRLALEERMLAMEEKKVATEERKVAMEEHQRLLEEERKLFFMDTSNMDERQKEYINLARDEVLEKKRKLANLMKAQNEGFGAPFGGVGGYGGVGSMGGFGGMGGFEGYGAPFGGMGGYGGMGLGSMGGMSGQSAMGGMGGMRGQSAMGGMGAQPGEFMASLMDPSPSTNDDSTGNTIVQDSYEDAQHGGGDGMDNVDK